MFTQSEFSFPIDDDNHITMVPIQGKANSHTDFINASYIDVSRLNVIHIL